MKQNPDILYEVEDGHSKFNEKLKISQCVRLLLWEIQKEKFQTFEVKTGPCSAWSINKSILA